MNEKPKQLSKELVDMLEALSPERRKAIEELATKRLLLDHMKRRRWPEDKRTGEVSPEQIEKPSNSHQP